MSLANGYNNDLQSSETSEVSGTIVEKRPLEENDFDDNFLDLTQEEDRENSSKRQKTGNGMVDDNVIAIIKKDSDCSTIEYTPSYESSDENKTATCAQLLHEDTLSLTDTEIDEQPGDKIQNGVDGEQAAPNDHLSHGIQVTPDNIKPSLVKDISSIYTDAKQIVSILGDADVDDVYIMLKERRLDPNRVDTVINEILENIGTGKEIHPKTPEPPSAASLLEDFVRVVDKAMANMSAIPFKAEEIQQMLERERDHPDRVDRVFSQILSASSHGNKKANIDEDVRKVLSKMPGAHPDDVRKLLIERNGAADRVSLVVTFLENQTVSQLKHDQSGSFIEDQILRNDPIFRDMRIIKKVLPDRDPNEIYAYLEAHHDKKNRIMLVIDELKKTGSVDSQEDNKIADVEKGHLGPAAKVLHGISDEVDELKDIFPDCDPNYLYNELEKHQDDKNRVENLAATMLKNADYPKLKDVLKEENKRKTRSKITHLKFDLNEFLSKFPDPKTTFSEQDKQFSENYKKHVNIQMLNDFPQIQEQYIQDLMKSQNHHLGSCRTAINSQLSELGVFVGELYAPDPRPKLSYPEEPDEFFFYEKLYLENESTIQDYLQQQERLKELRKQEARVNGEFLECGCCFDDECLFEDMSSCADGHLFCKDCIRRSADVVIGQGKCDCPCLEEGCEFKFPLQMIQMVLPANMFSILLRRMQEEEIKQADIPDLVSCPFCSFATIMTNPEDKVFKCLNPKCLKDSCRLCGEPDHIPLRCNEVEKQGETDMRTYIENRVTEAMIRTCHRCKKRFVKEFGCNKMTCTCGATQCYVCRAEDIDYDHFDGTENRNCNNHDLDIDKLHVQEMEEAAKAAREQYIIDHPDVTDIVLKYDPQQHIQDMKKKMDNGERLFNQDGYDEYNSEESNSDMEY